MNEINNLIKTLNKIIIILKVRYSRGTFAYKFILIVVEEAAQHRIVSVFHEYLSDMNELCLKEQHGDQKTGRPKNV